MSVTFPGDNTNFPRVRRTTGLIVIPFSVSMWVMFNTLSALRRLFGIFGSGANNAPVSMGTNATGKLLASSVDGGDVAGATTLSTATWYYLAMTVVSSANTGTAIGYINSVSEVTNSNLNGGPSATEVAVGGSSGDRNADARIAAVKMWSAVLTVAEIENERWSYMPKKTASLYAVLPFEKYVDPEVDLSGTAHDFARVGGGTLSTSDGPPIVWAA